MSFVNVPPAPGSSGQNIESVVVTSSQHRQTFTVGSFNTTAMAPVTSSGGLLIHVTNPSTAVTITNATTAVSLSSAAALSSGTVTLSSVHTVTATAGTNPWSSAPGFNIPFVSASSGALQISGTPLVNIVGTSSGIAPVTTSGGLGVTILAGAGGSTTVNLSSATALSSGIVTLSSVHTVTATAATNPWSSAPDFNIPFVSASSGLLQISGTPLVNVVGTSSGIAPVTTSGGLGVTILGGAASGSTAVNLVGSSNGIAPVTTSGGLGVTILAGTISASTAVSLSSTPQFNLVGTSSGVAPVTTSGGLGVTILAGAAGSTTVNLSSATALSSGIVTLSSVHTVTATAGTNPWSSAPSFNIPFVSASSGLLQISGTPLVNIVGTSSGVAPVTTSGGLGVTILGGAASGSTAVNLVGSSNGIGPVTTSGGLLVTVVAGADQASVITSSAGFIPATTSAGLMVRTTLGTNPWSSAPSFNIPFVSASSGLLQISGTPLVNIVGTSSGVAPVTTSGGLGVTILGGAASGSTAVNIVGSSNGAAVVTTSGGLSVTIVAGAVGSTVVSLSSAPLVIVATSGGTFLTALTSGTVTLSSVHSVTLSSVHTVTATAATNPWSSAPGFNVPIVSNSSGVVQAIGSTNRVYSAFAFECSSSASYTAISTSARVLYGWNVGSQAAGQTCIRMYNSTSTTLGSTSNLIAAIPIPGSTGLGAGNNMMLPEGITFGSVMTFMIVDNFRATSTALGTHSAGDITGTIYYI